MLKKELEREYNLTRELLNDKYGLLNDKDKQIKELLKDKELLEHHQKTQESVVNLIDSLSAILCPESTAFHRSNYGLGSEHNRSLPEPPKDELFSVMQEIKTRMMNSGLTHLHLL